MLVQKNKVQMVCDNCLKALLMNLEQMAKDNAKRLKIEKDIEKRKQIERAYLLNTKINLAKVR